MRTITVKGTGSVSARPDYIILSLNIEALSETYLLWLHCRRNALQPQILSIVP